MQPQRIKRQQAALFLNFILVRNSTCFGQTYCPSSRVLNTVFTAIAICHTIYVDCLLARLGWILTSLADNMTNTNCCEYSNKTPDDGQ